MVLTSYWKISPIASSSVLKKNYHIDRILKWPHYNAKLVIVVQTCLFIGWNIVISDTWRVTLHIRLMEVLLFIWRKRLILIWYLYLNKFACWTEIKLRSRDYIIPQRWMTAEVRTDINVKNQKLSSVHTKQFHCVAIKRLRLAFI